jgi:response regulator RpfG family c-di-GMP phosphodiesterase
MDAADLAERDIQFVHAIARLVEDHLHRQTAERRAREEVDSELIATTAELREARSRLNVSSIETVLRLSKAVEYRDDDTGSHTARALRLERGSHFDPELLDVFLANPPGLGEVFVAARG